MAITEARHRANEKYNAKAYEEIKVRVKKGEKDIIQSKASECGESVNAYINRAIDELMNVGGGYGIAATENAQDERSRSISHMESLFSDSELKQITALLKDGQTVDEYIRVAVLDRLHADTKQANQETDALSVMKRLANLSREEQDKAIGIKPRK